MAERAGRERSGRREGSVHRLAAVATLALLAAACEAAEPGGWAGTVDTLESGVVLVSNPGEGSWGSGEAWRLVEDLRIGAPAGEGPELFGEVRAVEVDPAGRIYVLDGQAHEVRVFSPDGAHLRTLGGEGDGPGELRNAQGLGWTASGHLLVVDGSQPRYTVFDTAGSLVGTHPRPARGFGPWRGRVGEEGRIYDAGIVQLGLRSFGQGLLALDTTFTVTDTLRLPEREGGRTFPPIRGSNFTFSMPVPFTSRLVWAVGPEGRIWTGTGEEYRIHLTDGRGDTLRTVRRDAVPAPVGPEDLELARERMARYREQGGEADESLLPGVKPFFDDLWVDPDGRLWVRRSVTDVERSRTFDLFDPEGRFLGTVESPTELSPHPVVRDGHVYGVDRDELDVPYVVRLAIEPGPEP